ncbi:MFS transporter [Streptomyces cinereoruber]|uniref:MFS transporter n=1 Tax=Streptomyces cinereoruber TaxID=67260 RepID=A0AAV4KDZ9_9ACTN|nr:MFS transporter [Streptomyces cinereoruber]MBB4158577.1 MFS family permease [Streptomyces cinereoruber]NIH59238.1 MFS family permease [Streptomyces cinereoruber]GGR03941.1 MFS transporter [Streptomyces cinereoruber]
MPKPDTPTPSAPPGEPAPAPALARAGETASVPAGTPVSVPVGEAVPLPAGAPASVPAGGPKAEPAPADRTEGASAPGSPTPVAGPGQGPVPPSPGYRAVFRVREFRFVFTAHLFSLLGVVVSELALTVLVYDLTRSPLLSSLTFALGFLPYLVGGTLLAGLTDRFPPRRILVVCDLVCAACVVLMTVPATPVAALLALRCAIAVVSPVFNGTRMATLADVLGEGDLFVLGRSLLRIVSQSALLAGFAAGGVLLTVVPPRGALVVTAATFLVSALLLRLGTVRRPARGGGDGEGGLAGTWALLRDRRVRALMVMFWVPPFFAVVPEALAAPYADEIGVSTAALGLLMCALPVGTITGELLAGSFLSAAARSRLVLPLAVTGVLPYLLYAVRPGVALAAAALFLAGATGAYTLGLDARFVAAVPEERRGRAMTLMTAGMMTVQGVGMAGAGLAAEFVPVHAVVAGTGVVGTLCLLAAAAELRATEGRDGADRHVPHG